MLEGARSAPNLNSSHRLSFIIKYLLPDVRGDIHKLCHSQQEQPDGSPGALLQAGSVAEGLSLPNMMKRQGAGERVPIAFNTDIDTAYCTEMAEGVRLETWKHNDELKPAFCRLLRLDSADGESVYCSSTKAKDKMKASLMSGLDSADFLFLDTPEERAAALLEFKELPLPMDAILAVCVEWPEEVSREWRKRVRPGNWPGTQLIDEITKAGIHLVPKAHASSKKKDVEWRFSFSLAEIKLARSLSEEQRLCYLALKALHHMELKEPKGLSSYHLKTILLWTCEKTPRDLWTMDQLACAFLTLLDEVIRCLKNGCIANYFVPEFNMIEPPIVKREDLNQWLKKLEVIRENPLPHLIRFHDLYRRISSLSPPQSEEKALQDYDRYAKGIRLIAKHGDSGDERNAFIAALFQLSFSYAAEGKFLDMVHLAAHFESLQHKLTMDEAPSQEHPAQVRLLVHFMEELVQHFTDSDADSPSHRMMVMIDTNLARLQHEASKVGESVSERDQSLAKSQEGFTKILTSVHHDASSALLFANFLYDQRRLDEAIVVLTNIKASARHAPPWCSFVVFNEFTAHTPDAFLKEEFLARTEVEYWVPTFTLYLLISCHADKGQSGKARELLPELFEERERSTLAFSYADTCVLLGYCYLRLGEREEALTLFKEAVDDYGSDSAEYWYKKMIREDTPA